MSNPKIERPDHELAREELAALAERLGLTMESTFVPFSQSRNAAPTDLGSGKAEPWLSLNWRCKLMRTGRLVLETDYGQGVAHAPAYKWKAPTAWDAQLKKAAIRIEIQTGKEARRPFPGLGVYDPTVSTKPIPAPPITDVLSSLLSDSDVLDAGGFEAWASDLGYDPDSRKAESIYRQCLESALKLRAALGEAELAAGREIAGRL